MVGWRGDCALLVQGLRTDADLAEAILPTTSGVACFRTRTKPLPKSMVNLRALRGALPWPTGSGSLPRYFAGEELVSAGAFGPRE